MKVEITNLTQDKSFYIFDLEVDGDIISDAKILLDKTLKGIPFIKGELKKSGYLNELYDNAFPAMFSYIRNSPEYFDEKIILFADEVEVTTKKFDRLVEEMIRDEKKTFSFNIRTENIEKTLTIEPYFRFGSKSTLGYDVVEYYMIHDNDFYGDESRMKTIMTLTPSIAAKIIKDAEQSKEDIVDYYVEKLLPADFLPWGKQTVENKQFYDVFSDWHKDCFRIRPHDNESNRCLQIFMDRGQKEKDYVNLVKSFNEKGEACPYSFHEYIKNKEEEMAEIEPEM